jgi:NTE family protein
VNVALALQGGGSHGAFTWGVLDRLLDDPQFEIEAISGASAGTVNAVALAHGMLQGGRDGAREALQKFWNAVAALTPPGFFHESFSESALRAVPSPSLQAFLALARYFAPYQLNPFDLNPLRDVLQAQIDFARLQRSRLKLFVATTRVRTGTLRVFRTPEIDLSVVLASACLPLLHHTVMIGGEPYWDGGLTANPPLYPLLHDCAVRDIIAVLLHPRSWPEQPTSAGDISHRLTEISFGAAFHSELQGIALARKAARQSWFAWGALGRRLRSFNLHVIDSPDLMGSLDALSQLNSQTSFIMALRDAGRERADAWLREYRSMPPTIDLDRLLE